AAGGSPAAKLRDIADSALHDLQLWPRKELGIRIPGPRAISADEFRRKREHQWRRGFSKARAEGGEPPGRQRAERCDRVRAAAAGRPCRQRVRSKFWHDRVPALGLGNGSRQYRYRANARQARRLLPGGHHRGTLEVEGTAGRRILLRRGNRTVANRIRPGRRNLASEG